MRHITVLAATLVCVTAAPTALAQMATWNGGSGNWTDPNWIINGMLTTIPNGAQVTANIPLGAVGLDTGRFFSVGGVTLTGTGNLHGQGQLTISGALLQDAGFLGASIDLTGPLSAWTGGTWGSASNRSTTVGPTGALEIGVSGDANMERRTLTNNGAVTHVNGRVTGNTANPPGGIAATAIINNGSWTESTVFALEFLGNGWSFANNGAFSKFGSGSTTFTGVLFDSVGSVDVQEGTLNLSGGGTSESTTVFNAEPGAAINFSTFSPSYTINGSALTGGGWFTATGTINMNGTIAASNLTLDGAFMTGTHTLSGPSFLWTGADIVSFGGNFGTTLAPTTSLEIDVTGDVNLSRRSLTNNGAVTHRGGSISGNAANPGGGIAASAIVNNGTWTESAGVPLAFQGNGWTYTNNSTFTKQGPESTTFAGVRFDNAGSVDVRQGTLNLNGGGTSGSTAVFNAEPGTAMNITGSMYTVNDSTFTGDGPFTVTANIHLGGTIEASNLTFDGTFIRGTHILSGPNFRWTGNDINSFGGASSTTLAPAAFLEIDVAGVVALTSRSLTNNGTLMHRGGNIGATAITNNGSWTESADVPLVFLGGVWDYTNTGTFTKQGTESTTFNNLRFDNTGTIDVQGGTLNILATFRQTAGEMILSGGDVAGALTFTGGSLRGSGSLADNVTMTGATLDPGMSAGLLNFGANLALNGASVPIELEGTSRGTTYDAIDAAGSLSLSGSVLQLDVTLLDPSTPIGTEFLIFDKASAPAISGTFAGLPEGTRFNSGIFEFEITYLGGDGNDVVLTVSDSSFCYADCDANAVLDIFDFLCFQNSFVAGEAYACDCDPDPACTLFDFLCFQSAFVGGCP